MSRPAIPALTTPAYSVRDWATDAAFDASAGAWSEQPNKVEPPDEAQGFVPGQGAGAPYINKLFSDAYTQDDSAKTSLTTLKTESQTAFTNLWAYLGQLAVINWYAKQEVSTGNNHHTAYYDEVSNKWYVTGTTVEAAVHSSNDAGVTWSASLISGVRAGATAAGGVGGDDGGNIVVLSDRYCFELDASTDTWTKRDMMGAAVTGAYNAVVYDVTNSLWCAIGPKTLTSPDRVTWTTRTGVADTDQFHCLAIKQSSGRIAAAGWDGATTIHIQTSDDGGATWTARTSKTTGVTPAYMEMAYNADRDEWLLSLGDTTTPEGELWRSTDGGVTWTKLLSTIFNGIRRPAPFGSMWVAAILGGADCILAYSLDGGETWKDSGFRSSNLVNMHSGGGQLIGLQSDDNLYRSMRVGTPPTDANIAA
jgi:hypothetical protein